MRERLTTVEGRGPVRRLQTQIRVEAPIRTVWASLTEPEHLKHWWSDGEVGNGPGQPIVLGGDEALSGTIVVMMEPYVFEFTWHDEPEKAAHPEWLEPRTKSLVRFDLVELGDETTLVTLVQFSPLASAVGASAGWHEIFEQLAIYCRDGQTVPNPSRFDELKALYESEA